MTGSTVTVTYIPTGEAFTVKRFTSTPNNTTRVALRMDAAGREGELTAPCAVCGEATAATATTAPVVETPYGPVTIPTGHADRAVNDLPNFTVAGGKVAYVRGTVINTCARHNLSSKRRLTDDELAAAEAAAIHQLRTHF